MSLPSDVNPDIPPSETRAPRPSRGKSRISREEQGWVIAALVAFFGVVYVGPAIVRYRRKPPLREQMARRLREHERRAQGLARRAGKRFRSLGGGRGWR